MSSHGCYTPFRAPGAGRHWFVPELIPGGIAAVVYVRGITDITVAGIFAIPNSNTNTRCARRWLVVEIFFNWLGPSVSRWTNDNSTKQQCSQISLGKFIRLVLNRKNHMQNIKQRWMN